MLLMSLFLTMTASTEDAPATRHFKDLTDQQHVVVNDSVMGGRSNSQLTRVDDGLRFTGTVSLENNGGFASARMIWPFSAQEVAESTLISFTVTGDGSDYQFRLRTNRGFDGAAYTQRFTTLKDKRQTIYLPVDEFVPTFRGRVLRDMPRLRLEDVQQMGVLIADEQTGDFAITLHQLTVETKKGR